MDDRVYWTVWTILLLAPHAVILTSMCAVAHMRRRRARGLEHVWAWIGKPHRHYGAGREWVGEVDGRRVEIDYFEDTTEVRVAAKPRVRVGFGRDDEPPAVVDEATHGGTAVPI